LLDLLFIVILSTIAFGLGRQILGWLHALPEHPVDGLSMSLPIGLGILSLATFAIGQLGWLNPIGLAALLIVSATLGWHARGFGWTSSSLTSGMRSIRFSLFHIFLLATLTSTFICALAPVTDGDALCYHLQVPKIWLAAGAPTYEPDLHESVYPALVETLYALGLAFASPVSCRLIQWTLGLCFAGLVTAVARPHLGGRAHWAGLIALLTPAITNGMAAPLNDVALATYGMAALYALTRWLDQPTIRRTVLVGFCCGLAIGVKYPALVWSSLIGLIMLGSSGATGRLQLGFLARARLARISLFAALLIATGGCWYLRAYNSTGNPVHPFFKHTFGGAGLDVVLDPIKRPLEVSPFNLMTALVPMTLQPDRFDSFSHQFGPAYLLFLPAFLLSRPSRRLTSIVGLGYLFLVVCLTQRQSMRFVLIAVGPMAIGVASVASQWFDRREITPRLLIATLVLVLGFQLALAASRTRHVVSVALGIESREHYLHRREPTYQVGRWVAENLSSNAHIIGQDHRGYYFPCSYTMELAHRRRTGLGLNHESASQIVSTLRSRGFTHLLMCPPTSESAVEFDPELGRLLDQWLADRSPLYSKPCLDQDGVTRCYAIYDLAPLAIAASSKRGALK
jgi:Protein of unknown function (DUF1420)